MSEAIKIVFKPEIEDGRISEILENIEYWIHLTFEEEILSTDPSS